MERRVVLASGSPRRKEILTRLGFKFEIHVSGADESGVEGEIGEVVRTLAYKKAEYVAREEENALVIGSDTLVSVDGVPLGKPVDTEDAVRMLKILSGRMHEVYSGLCVIDTSTGRYGVDFDISRVYFKPLTEAEIREYVAGGEPMDKAGAYAIQGEGSKFIDRIEGSFDNNGLSLRKIP